MLVATTENIAGHKTKQVIGQVFGLVVRSRGLGGNIMAGLRSIVGGEIHEYTKLMAESREQALDRLIEHAQSLGADAVIGLRFDATEAGAQTPATEVLAYGTAVKLA